MSLPFLYHLLISSCIFYIIATWFKFFLKLRLSIDFSYIAIVLFWSYASVLLNIHLWMGMLASMFFARLITLPFTLLIIFLSKRLHGVYFIVGTLALYMFFFQLALNREAVTWWAFWLSGMQRLLRWDTLLTSLWAFLIFTWIITVLLMCWLRWFKRTTLFTLLKWWGENSTLLRVLGTPIHRYTFILVLITSLCAVIWGNLYGFYFLFIDPRSFWLSMLVLVLVIAFVSYNQEEFATFFIAVMIIFIYEYLRFFKVVEPDQLGYFREWLFACIIMITSYITFKRTSFGRTH